MKTHADRIRFILARPEGSANIGAVCRAMKNMGLGRLTIVRDPAGIELSEVRRMALHAFDVFESAQFTSGLEEAVADTQLAIAVTRRHGAKRNKKSVPIGDIARLVHERPGPDIVFVFGNEEHGLSNDEVELCSAKLSIPTAPEFPSLNLAQAVQIVAYELYRGAATVAEATEEPSGGAMPPASAHAVPRERIEELTKVVMSTLDALGFFKNTDGHYTRQVFRDLFHRAGLRSAEADYVQRVFQKIRFIRREDEHAQ